MHTPNALSQAQCGAAAALEPVQQRRYLQGFGNLLRNELHQWWGTRSWWIHLLVWLSIINGFIALIGLAATQDTQGAGPPVGELAAIMFFQFSVIGTTIGAVLTAQGSIVGEKQLGTAAWMLSKPVSRSAFILAKLAAHLVGYLVLAIVIPSVVFVVQVAVQWERTVAVVPFLVADLLSLVNLLFYLALTLMLGTLFVKRGPVAGLAFGFMFAGTVMRSMIPGAHQFTPWMFADLAGAIAQGQLSPARASGPIAGTLLVAGLFLVVALWRFHREEF